MVGDEAYRVWVAEAVECVEDALRKLTEGFKTDPYEHRVEHSLHVKLYDLLMDHDHLSGWCPIGDGKFRTRLVQKEWPGQKRIAIRGTRESRQTFDLGVLAPDMVRGMTPDEFANGRRDPVIAIELGLDYGLSHVAGDLEKLTANKIAHRYVVHFSRKRTRDARTVEELLEAQTAAKWVFVHIDVDDLSMRYCDLDTLKVSQDRYEPANQRQE